MTYVVIFRGAIGADLEVMYFEWFAGLNASRFLDSWGHKIGARRENHNAPFAPHNYTMPYAAIVFAGAFFCSLSSEQESAAYEIPLAADVPAWGSETRSLSAWFQRCGRMTARGRSRRSQGCEGKRTASTRKPMHCTIQKAAQVHT